MLQNKNKANSLLFKNYLLPFRVVVSMGNAFTEQTKVKVNRFLLEQECKWRNLGHTGGEKLTASSQALEWEPPTEKVKLLGLI